MNKLEFHHGLWNEVAPGCQEIRYSLDQFVMRLVEFNGAFKEEDWCVLGHQGYVLNGEFHIDFDGSKINFQQGDGLYIPAGQRHRLFVESGRRTRIILFENHAK